MEGIRKFRHNAMGITTISGFGNIKGGINGCCKDVYFVRALGVSPSYLDEIKEMDAVLSGLADSGRGYYCRLDSLPRLQDAEDISFYTDCYSKWEETGKRKAVTRATQGTVILEELLGNACTAVEKIGLQAEMHMSGSICRNMIVKMLFWFDSVFGQAGTEWDEKKVWKIAAVNVGKKQEYLFFYLLTLTGCDVLLLQSRGDIGEAEEKLGLSAKFVLGGYSEAAVPAYERNTYRENNLRQGQDSSGIPGTAYAAENGIHAGQEGCIRVKIPERQPRKRHAGRPAARDGAASWGTGTLSGTENMPGADVPAAPEAGGTTLPQAGRVQGASAPSGAGAMPKVTIPQRPGRVREPAMPPESGNMPYASGHDGPGQNRNAEKSFEELARLAASVVMISIHDNKGDVIGTGSGIMVGRQGYILTNNHVASGGKFYSVRIEDDDKVYSTSEVIKYNYVLDLAVIRINRELTPIPVYQGQKKLVRGQKVVAIGSPLGLFNSVSDGIISGFRKIDNVDMIQFTAPTSHGSSGGAVLNMQGEVIGISTAGFDAGQNINLAMGYECINLFIKGFT